MRTLAFVLLSVTAFAQAEYYPPAGSAAALGAATLAGNQTFLGTNTFSATLTSSVASSSNAFLQQAGAKFCLSSGCLRYITETSSEIYFRGSRIVVLDGGGYFNGAVDFLTSIEVQGNITNEGSSKPIYLNDLEGTCVGNQTGVDCDGALSTGTLKIGLTGTAISTSYMATSTIDFASTTTTTVDSTGITVTGAAAGAPCIVGAPIAAMVAGASFTCYVSAADTVKVRFTATGATVDPASGTFTVRTF